MLDHSLEMNLFKEELKDSLVFHIPHSSIHFPNFKGYILDSLEEEINIQTDWATERIFDVPNTKKVVTPFSRLFCDVERFFDDEKESMFSVGRGYFNTHTHNGNIMRELVADNKFICAEYYADHHKKLSTEVYNCLKNNDVAYIIDCHSFSNIPLPFEDNKKSRPDICLGTDNRHTPQYLINYLFNFFTSNGLTVEINYPYAGCIIPEEYFGNTDSVFGVMIEINKKLYMSEKHAVKESEVKFLNDLIVKCFSFVD